MGLYLSNETRQRDRGISRPGIYRKSTQARLLEEWPPLRRSVWVPGWKMSTDSNHRDWVPDRHGDQRKDWLSHAHHLPLPDLRAHWLFCWALGTGL